MNSKMYWLIFEHEYKVHVGNYHTSPKQKWEALQHAIQEMKELKAYIKAVKHGQV